MDLQVPATDEERFCWNKSLLPYHYFSTSVDKHDCGDDFENPRGYYALLGCSKTSREGVIAEAFNKTKSKQRETVLALHPDKNDDPSAHDALKNNNNNMGLVRAAYHVLGFCDADDNYPARVQYKKDGEMIRDAFKFEFDNIHNGISFTTRDKIICEEKERHKTYKKKKATTTFS